MPEVGTYTIQASDGALTPAVSFNFDITAIKTTLAPGQKASFTDANGSTLTVTYTGKAGSAVISRAETNNLPGDILSIDITGSDAKAALTILSTGGSDNGLTTIGTITDDSVINAITGKDVNISGAGVIFSGGGYANTLTLHDLAAGAAVVEPGNNSKGVTITLAAVGGGAMINLGSGATLALADWSGNGSVTAPWLISLKTTGDQTRSLAGNFGASLNLSGIGAPKGVALGSAAILGNITGGTWAITGAAGAVSANATAAPWQTTISGVVASLTTKAAAAGTLGAGSLTKLTVGGDSNLILDLTGAGVLAGKTALGAATIKGNIAGGLWTVVGAAGAVTANAIDASWQTMVTGNIASITTKGSISGDIQAGSITMLKVGGDLTGATINLTQVSDVNSPKVLDLTSLTVTGQTNDVTLQSNGNLGALTFGVVSGLDLFAGVTAPPATAGDFISQAAIKSVKFTEPSTPDLTGSVIAGWSLGTVTLLGGVDSIADIDTNTVTSLSYIDPTTHKITKLAKPASSTAVGSLILTIIS